MSAPIIIIPASLNSTRLPNKLLLNRTGRTLLWHTHSNALRVPGVQSVWVATDSDEIAEECKRHYMSFVMTTRPHDCGSSRVVEAAEILARDGVTSRCIINLQADEPEVDPAVVSGVIGLLGRESYYATAACPITPGEWADPNCVKVLVNKKSRAAYFSRAPIPHGGGGRGALRHIGVYGFSLLAMSRMGYANPGATGPAVEATTWDGIENLEQLRWLEFGSKFNVFVTPDRQQRAINTPEDYAEFVQRADQAGPS